MQFVTQEFPPFTYLSQGQVGGPATEVIRRVCKEMEKDCKFDLLPWRRALSLAKKGAYHGVYLIGWNPSRTDWMHFSLPLINTEYGIFVASTNPMQFQTTKDIQGYSIAVYGPSNTSHYLQQLVRKADSVKINMYPQVETGFLLLSRNRVDGVYSNRDVGLRLLQQLGIKNVRYSGQHRELRYFVGFPKQKVDRHEVEAFNQTYLKLLNSGEIDRLLDPYGMKAQQENF